MAAPKEHKDLSKETLTARLRDAAKGPISFVFALSKGGKGHYLVLHKIKEGKSLLTFVRGKQPDAGKAAYGKASLTPTGLELDCEKELPGMTTAAKAWVAANRHPKVKKIKVLVGGAEVAGEDGEDEGDAPPDDADAVKLAKLKTAVGGRIKAALAAATPAEAEKMTKLLGGAKKREKAEDVAGALELYKALAGLVTKSAAAPAAAAAAAPTVGPLPKEWKAALRAWRDASDEVDSQINRFVGALKKSGDEDLEEIGSVTDFGINALTGNTRVKLLAALRDLDKSTPDSRAAAAANAKKALERFTKYIAREPRIALIDENDLTKVSIRSTLGAGLSKLAGALKTIAGS